MTSQEALRKLRNVGWKLVSEKGRHFVLEKDGQRTIVAMTTHLSPRHEQGVKRLLAGRPTKLEVSGHRG